MSDQGVKSGDELGEELTNVQIAARNFRALIYKKYAKNINSSRVHLRDNERELEEGKEVEANESWQYHMQCYIAASEIGDILGIDDTLTTVFVNINKTFPDVEPGTEDRENGR